MSRLRTSKGKLFEELKVTANCDYIINKPRVTEWVNQDHGLSILFIIIIIIYTIECLFWN
jgi:hypothetical protein